MKPIIQINRPQTLKLGLFHNNPVNYYVTYVDGFVRNPFNNIRSDLTKRFRIDTGADITILNRQFNQLFSDGRTPVVNTTEILYGGNSRILPVYEIELKIDGHDIRMLAAHDANMNLDSLLGHYNFINDFDSFNVSGKRKNFKLIKN